MKIVMYVADALSSDPLDQSTIYSIKNHWEEYPGITNVRPNVWIDQAEPRRLWVYTSGKHRDDAHEKMKLLLEDLRDERG